MWGPTGKTPRNWEMGPARLSGSWRCRSIDRHPLRTPANWSRSGPGKRPNQAAPPSVRRYKNRLRRTNRRQTIRSAGTGPEALNWRFELELGSERFRGRAVGPELDLSWELESGSALGPVPTKSHTAQPRRPKLPGISSRFLLEINFDVWPLKGRLIFGALAVSLKRYPDTNPAEAML